MKSDEQREDPPPDFRDTNQRRDVNQAQWLAEIAAQIADGRLIDWPAVEARAQDDHDRGMIRRLQSIQRLAHAQTALTAPGREEEAVLSSWGALTILEKVGRGTFGDVYRAWDPRLDRHVALKILRRRETAGPGAESAIIEEARLMARVRHPNIVTVYGAERIDGRVGIWMEFVEGLTLEQELRDKGPLSGDDVLAVAVDLCGALGAVHQAGLLHRDLKAQNVMRATDGRILLTDFGAGRDGAQSSEGDEIELAGTPLYLAPELFAGQRPTIVSDLYALGVLLYHLGTGEFPVRAPSLRAFRDAHTHPRVPTRKVRADLPRSLATVIDRLLSVNPPDRYLTSAEVTGALKGLMPQTVWMMAAGVVVTLVSLAVLFDVGSVRSRWFGEVGTDTAPVGIAASARTRKLNPPASQWLGQPSRDGRYFAVRQRRWG
ncbi:MAG: serine/threonine protein kinase [Acidobacteria bacterium]|nr:serine/threonine protein kinase [Acidobacteriota bacterium]